MSTASTTDHALPDADALVRVVMERDAAEPGYAVAIVRLLIARLPTADVLAIDRRPPASPASAAPDAQALIG